MLSLVTGAVVKQWGLFRVLKAAPLCNANVLEAAAGCRGTLCEIAGQ